MNRVTKTVLAFQKYSGKKWYLPLMGGLAAADLFVGIVPTDALLVTTVALRPKHWIRLALFFATASAIGAVGLSEVARIFGDGALHGWITGLGESAAWTKAEIFMQKHGKIALILMAAGPLPQQPAVALCGISHMPVWEVFLSVWVGRLAKYLVFAYVATHMPHVLRRLGIKKDELLEIAPVIQLPPKKLD